MSESGKRGTEAAGAISLLCNYSGNEGADAFLEMMSRDHRTLQQSFTRLCLEWLEQVAERQGPQYVDARNEDSQRIAQQLMQGFIAQVAEKNKITVKEVMDNWDIYKPSKWLGYV